MGENIDSEGSDTVPMNPQDTPAGPQPAGAPEVPFAQANPVGAPAIAADAPAYAVEPTASAPKSGFTISHRALWITGAVVLSLALLAASFGFGVGVGRHSDRTSARGEVGAWRMPDSRTDGWQGQGPRCYDDGQNDGPREYDRQRSGQHWRGPGYRGVPRGQVPTGTPSL